MGQPTLLDNMRGFIGGIAWRVFLWSIRMNDAQYDYLVHAGCNPANGSPACEHGYNGICVDCDAPDDIDREIAAMSQEEIIEAVEKSAGSMPDLEIPER